MISFTSSKNGYNKKEVELYIKDIQDENSSLKSQNEKLKKDLDVYKSKEKDIFDKDKSISIALTAAVEKAKQIEKSSNNVYKLKIEQLNLLYQKWETLLNEIVDKYPEIEKVENVKKLLSSFRNDLKSTLKEDFKLTSNSPVKTRNDTMRLLLDKLKSRGAEEPKKKIKVERKQLSKDMLNSQTELNRIEDKSSLIKPIYKSELKSDDKYENLADKFLKDDSVELNAYSNIITSKVKAIPEVNETGFDLKEAINPTEDLDEIMKAFDFFSDENDE